MRIRIITCTDCDGRRLETRQVRDGDPRISSSFDDATQNAFDELRAAHGDCYLFTETTEQ